MTELQILSAIKNNGGYIECTKLLNLGLSDTEIDLRTDQARIKKLKEDGYIDGSLEANTYVVLKDEGRLYLAELKNKAEKESKQERQQRFDNKISVLSVLVPCITFVLGLIVDHYTNIVALFFSLFK